MQKEHGRSCWQYLPATYGSHRVISHHGWLSNCTQNTRFSIPSQHRNGIWCATRRGIHCSWSVPKPSLDDALSWWYEPPYASFRHSWVSPWSPFFTKVDSQNAHKKPNFKYPLSAENEMPLYNERYPLLMKCFWTFLRFMRQMGGASLCILLPLKGHTESLCSMKVHSRITNKNAKVYS